MSEAAPSKTLPVVAAFDFDGTLSYHDTLVPFLMDACGSLRTLFHMALLLPAFAGFACKLVTRQAAKEAVLKRLLAGRGLAEVKAQGYHFANGKLTKLINPEGLKRLRWHQKQGHRCILVSASLDVYLAPWSEREGFHGILASRLEATPAGIVTGNLQGLNCWGPEKVRRLDELLGPRKAYQLYAYGDSRGDKDLLAYADFPFYRKWE